LAWVYYGTPVPHPVVAKSLQAGPKTLLGLLDALLGFPQSLKSPYSALNQMFAPVYALYGGWPFVPRMFGLVTSAVCAVLWLVPPLRVETKAASFSFFGVSLYLSYYPPLPFPWYLCLPAALGFLTLAGVFAQGWDAATAWRPPLRWIGWSAVAIPAIAVLTVGSWFTVASAKQLKLQQQIVENANRRKIGEWLRDNAAPGDTVFLEPLGYISYFSGLKTYDYPGLSSTEVVAAVRRVGSKWGALILELQPKWLVLRPFEIDEIVAERPNLLAGQYEPVREFNVRDQVMNSNVHGREYVAVDSVFFVLKRRP
jgi:hypothetical protein